MTTQITPATSATGTGRQYSRSNATRLLSAGTYLEKAFRARVIRELVTHQYRVVAPSYGYDAVAVLAHALAARRLWRQQIAGVIVGLAIDFLLLDTGVIGLPGALLLALWLLWALAFLRRVATLQVLIRHLGRTGTADRGFAGDAFPASRVLTGELAAKITREQAGTAGSIFYGGYYPFVGAGWPLPDWSTAEMLLPAQPDAVTVFGDEPDEDELAEPAQVIPFTADDITTYVSQRLRADLSEDVPLGERVQNLTVERSRYSRAGMVPVRRRWLRAPVVLQIPSDTREFRPGESAERYDATREYLCVRVGSWDEELVTSIFVSFDVRGNTLYSEFYPYVLPPVMASFHLVDRLPERLTPGLLLRVAWHVPADLSGAVLRAAARWPGRVRRWLWGRDQPKAELAGVIDASEFRLGRYSAEFVDRGAVASLREMAAARDFFLFFQETDTVKYVKIVQRRLLQIIEEFLKEHNVDLRDHQIQQTNIIDNSFSSVGNVEVNNSPGAGVANRWTRQSTRLDRPGPSRS